MIACTQAIAYLFKNQAAQRQANFALNKHNHRAQRRHNNSDDDNSDNEFIAADPVEGANLNIPIKTKLRKAKNQKQDDSCDDNKKWNKVNVNAEILAEAENEGNKSGNLIDNEGQPIIKNVIPVEAVGDAPQDIIQPLDIDQTKAQYHKAAKYNKYRKNYNRSYDDQKNVIRTQIRIGEAN